MVLNVDATVECIDLDDSEDNSDEVDQAAKILMPVTHGIGHLSYKAIERTALPTPNETYPSPCTTTSYEYRQPAVPISFFEALPTELLQDIATLVNDDQDLSQIMLTSSKLAKRLTPHSANIWRKRFLARYDHPFVTNGDTEFAIAYQIRRLVLRKLDGHALGLSQRQKAEHQLLVVRDMILETYNKAKAFQPFPQTSKNLAAMSSPDLCPWIVHFMGCALFGNLKRKYGRHHNLFDSIQVTLSHLVLSQRSPVLLRLSPSRENYDLIRVYSYNKPLALLLERVVVSKHPGSSFKGSRIPDLKCSTTETEHRYKVDMHTILHIRNFWQRHFADNLQGVGENTYASMARSLVRIGKPPQTWSSPLQEKILLNTKWYGHYSCLHPWPTSKQDLEERQSCAEDWDVVDPMTLEFETSTDQEQDFFWPRVFGTIPVLKEALPVESQREAMNVTYLRGIAPFLESDERKQPKSSDLKTENGSQKLQKWHPYLASRVHGFVHDVPDEAVLGGKARKERFSTPGEKKFERAIPGWKRIVMIIYKPTTRQLISTLEYAEANYGGAWGTQISLNTAEIWNDRTDLENSDAATSSDDGHEENSPTATDDLNANTGANVLNNGIDIDSSIGATSNPQSTEVQIEKQLKKLLVQRINSFTESYSKSLSEQSQTPSATTPSATSARFDPKTKAKTELLPLFSAKHIRRLEEEFSSARFMTWDEGSIEYAYAYEGIIIPGGKIMLGRWWRVHGIEGMGRGKEIGPDGTGVEVRPTIRHPEQETEEITDGHEVGRVGKTKSKKRRRVQRPGKNKKRCVRRMHRSWSKHNNHDNASSEIGELEERNGTKYVESDYQSDGYEHSSREDEPNYEFVTMLNGEESRAVNSTKQLERGPFVFWAD